MNQHKRYFQTDTFQYKLHGCMILLEKIPQNSFQDRQDFERGHAFHEQTAEKLPACRSLHPVPPSTLCSARLCTACSETYKWAEKFPSLCRFSDTLLL